MRSAWPSNRPAAGVFQRPGTPEPVAFTTKTYASFAPNAARFASSTTQAGGLAGVIKLLTTPITQLIQNAFGNKTGAQATPAPLADMARQWQAQIDTYAEHPTEADLFGVQKQSKGFAVSQAWAQAIRTPDAQTRDGALNLLKGYLSYTGAAELVELSPHSQMKFLIFTPHLNENALGKAIVYEAVLSLDPRQILEFASVLQNDFPHLPSLAQVMVLKQMMSTWKARHEELDETDATAFRKMMRALIIQFYSGRQEALGEMLQQSEKIRLGFLKMQPVEQAYHQEHEEIEKKYRQKLRQLKKQRAQKAAEVDEKKQRRIELIYDVLENDLMAGLNDVDLAWDTVLAG